MGKSIISNDKKCFICGSDINLHKHHIFYGTANRRISEKQGCWVYLCAKHHNLSKEGVHYDKEKDLYLKKFAQATWEMEKGSREEFIKIFGRNYL